MFKQQRKSPFSPPRLGWMLCVLVFGLLLALPVAAFECDDCVFTHPDASPLDWQTWQKIYGQRPAKLTDEEITLSLAVASIAPQSKVDYDTAVIAKWDQPLSIRLVDGNNKDIPTSATPGKEISEYLAQLSRYINLPIRITTHDTYTSNFSIVLGRLVAENGALSNSAMKNNFSSVKDPRAIPYTDIHNMQIETISGLPSFSERAVDLSVTKDDKFDGWTGVGPIRSSGPWPFSDDFYRQYFRKNNLRACYIFLGFDWEKVYPVDATLQRLDKTMAACLGLSDNAFVYIPDRKLAKKIRISVLSHRLFYLRLLYSSAIKPGTLSRAVAHVRISIFATEP